MAQSEVRNSTPPDTKRRRYWPVWIAGLVLTGAMAVSGWQLWFARQAYYSDADTINQPAGTAVVRDILWQPPQRLAGLINTLEDDYEPRPSADGQLLYLVRGKAGENADIYCCERTLEGWSRAFPLERISSEFDDLGPEPSADGKKIYFYSDRPGGSGGYDLWMAERDEDGWQPPVNLGPTVNSEYNDYGPAITPDGKTLYFSSNRPSADDEVGSDPNAWIATLREDLYHRDYDLYSTALSERGWSNAAAVEALNTPQNEGAAAISPFGDFLYFSSDRPGGVGGFDLYRAWIRQGALQEPTNLGSAVNTPANELDPGMAMGGYELYFSSDRRPERADPQKPNDYNLYYTSSREVFEDYKTRTASMNWAAFWEEIFPNLLWLLLSLLLMLLLFYLLRGEAYRKLSLLVRCLLVSTLLHMLLLFLLSFWNVSAAIAQALRRDGGTRVVLASPAGSNEIAVQIRGRLADFEMPSPSQREVERLSREALVEPEDTQVALDISASRLEFVERLEFERQVNEAPQPMPTEVSFHEPDVSLGEQVQPVDVRVATPSTAKPANTQEAEIVAHAEPVVPYRARVRPQEQVVSQFQTTILEVGSPSAASAGLAEKQTSLHRSPDEPELAGVWIALEAPSVDVGAIALHAAPELAPVSLPQVVVASDEATESTPQVEPLLIAAAPRAVAFGLLDAVEADSVHLEPEEFTPLQAASDSISQFEPLDVEYSSESIVADLPAVKIIPVHIPEFRVGNVAVPGQKEQPSEGQQEITFDTSALAEEDHAAERHQNVTVAPITGEPTVVALMPTRDGIVDSRETSLVAVNSTIAEPANLQTPASDTSLSVRSVSIPSLPDLLLALPTETTTPPNPYVQRSDEERKELVERKGGSEETERAVALALKWLAAHQSADGRWDARRFDENCGACRGKTKIKADVALTGLSLLCFLAVDHTHVREGEYQDTVRRGLDWLIAQQESSGDLRGGETMYSHGIATIALSEAYGMTADPALARRVQTAVDFIHRARNRSEGGWRYDPGQAGDTSVLGWQVMALKSARAAGAEVQEGAFDVARRWLDRVSQGTFEGLYAYQPGRKYSRSMTAEAMFVQQLLGRTPNELRMRTSAQFVARQLPDWEDDPNTYLWYYGTLALFQHQGEEWRDWNGALTKQLLRHQHQTGKTAGSWDSTDRWSKLGGRVYQTTLCTLMLEVYYRYLPSYMQPSDDRQAKRGSESD